MAAIGLTRFPVIRQSGERELLGLVGLQDLLKARELSVADEHHRERVLRLRIPPSLRWRGSRGDIEGDSPNETATEPTVAQQTGTKET